VIVAHPASHSPERMYAARVVLGEFLGLRVETVVEDRTDTELRLEGCTLRLGDGFFAVPECQRLSVHALPPEPVHRQDGLPVLWRTDDDLGVDVLGGSFFLLTRLEELVRQERDEHDRFPAAATVAARAGFLRRPLVNEYVELLWQALRRTWPRLERRELRFVLVPSHDVDWPLSSHRGLREMARGVAADAVRARDPATALRRMTGFVLRHAGQPAADVNNRFQWMMDASERRGLRSSFFFIARRRPAGPYDTDYSLDDRWTRRLLRRIHARGHEIGLHPSYTTYLDPAELRREREALAVACRLEGIEQERWGGRQHFLRFRVPVTWRNWAEAGIEYDSTLGFAEDVGFRSGVCLEYPVYDLVDRRELPLRELPLVAMEGAVLDRLALDHERAFDCLADVKATCRRFGGTFTLLWHNSRLVHRRDRRLYEAVLDA